MPCRRSPLIRRGVARHGRSPRNESRRERLAAGRADAPFLTTRPLHLSGRFRTLTVARSHAAPRGGLGGWVSAHTRNTRYTARRNKCRRTRRWRSPRCCRCRSWRRSHPRSARPVRTVTGSRHARCAARAPTAPRLYGTRAQRDHACVSGVGVRPDGADRPVRRPDVVDGVCTPEEESAREHHVNTRSVVVTRLGGLVRTIVGRPGDLPRPMQDRRLREVHAHAPVKRPKAAARDSARAQHRWPSSSTSS